MQFPFIIGLPSKDNRVSACPAFNGCGGGMAVYCIYSVYGLHIEGIWIQWKPDDNSIVIVTHQRPKVTLEDSPRPFHRTDRITTS